MFETPKEKAEKIKAIKKLMAKWRRGEATEQKANILLSKNPDLKVPKKNALSNPEEG